MAFDANNIERMRITSAGELIVGQSATGYASFAPANAATSLVMKLGYGSDFSAISADSFGGNLLIGADESNTKANSFIGFRTDAQERARIDASGNLLVGLTAAQSGLASDAVGLTLFGSTAPGTAVFTRDSINPVVYVNNKTSGGGLVQFYNGGNQVGSINSNGTTTSYVTTSDARLKHDIVDAPDAANLIDAIQVRSFKWNADNSEQRYGFIAQELVEVAPEVVSQPADPEEMMGVDYSKLVPMLVKELQSLRARVAQLEGN
jgi:hypothetical protein